jgi:hypothetical protein
MFSRINKHFSLTPGDVFITAPTLFPLNNPLKQAVDELHPEFIYPGQENEESQHLLLGKRSQHGKPIFSRINKHFSLTPGDVFITAPTLFPPNNPLKQALDELQPEFISPGQEKEESQHLPLRNKVKEKAKSIYLHLRRM